MLCEVFWTIVPRWALKVSALSAMARAHFLLFMSREFRDIGVEEGDEVKITRTSDCRKIIIEKINDDTKNEPAQPDSGD